MGSEAIVNGGQRLHYVDHGGDGPVVIGTSQGGFVGLRMALLAPARVAALVLLGTSAAAEDVKSAEHYRQLRDTWVAGGPVEGLLDMVAVICLGDTPAAEWKAKWRGVDGARFAPMLDTLVGRDGLLHRLAEVRCPTLVLHGSADAAYPLCRAAEIVEGVPSAEPLVVVDGGAHFLSLTDATAVNPHLREFLAKHAAGSDHVKRP